MVQKPAETKKVRAVFMSVCVHVCECVHVCMYVGCRLRLSSFRQLETCQLILPPADTVKNTPHLLEKS